MSSPIPENILGQFERHIYYMQDTIVEALERLDPTAPPFNREIWGSLEDGNAQGRTYAFPPPNLSPSNASPSSGIFARGNVNVSIVKGVMPAKAVEHVSQMSIPTPEKGHPFRAAGLSLVLHPRNPHAPTVHFNYRMFELHEQDLSAENIAADDIPKWWFGGGGDLTPHYLYENDAVDFHKTWKDACDPFGTGLYPAFKSWCDKYFYLNIRKEARGIGGIFFDNLNDLTHPMIPNDGTTQRPRTPEELFKFACKIGETFLPAYLPILERRMSVKDTERERYWQALRHGRYIEFNLIQDSGMKFGFNTPGVRIEDLMLCMPKMAQWEYQSRMGTEEWTEEWKLMQVLLNNPKNWV